MPVDYELSPLQRGMLAVALTHSHSGADVLQVVIRTPQDFSLPAADAAWQALVDECDALRVAFTWSADKPSQRVHPGASLVAGRASGDLGEFLARDRRRGFDFSNPPLMRVTYLTLPANELAMVVSVHHAIIDGRSLLLLLERWQQLYSASLNGKRARERLWVSGLDFLATRLAQIDKSKARAHWQQAMSGYSSQGGLSQWSTPNEEGNLHRELLKPLPPELKSALERAATAEGVTMNNIVQTAWALTLHAFTGETDLLFGSTRSGRGPSRPKDKEPLGNFVNTVPVRVTLGDEKESISAVLKRVREFWRGTQEFDQVDLADIRSWCGLGGSRLLFESSVGVERYLLQEALEATDPAWSERKVTLTTQTPLPLMLLAHLGKEVLLELEYDEVRFPAEVAQSLVDTVHFVLEQIAENPSRTLGSLRWMRTLVTTPPSDPQDRTAYAVLEKAASVHAEQIAVEHHQETLTYAQLWEQSRTLAGSLHHAGVRQGDAVVVLLERGIPLARAVFAIQHLGAIYTPLEPRHVKVQAPAALRYGRTRFVLTSQALAKELGETAHTVLIIEQLAPGSFPEVTRPAPSAPAYTLFTSGSTGAPKPVEVSQHNLGSYIEAVGPKYDIGPGTRWLQLSSLSFDISVEELFVSWGSGGTVVFRPDESGVELETIDALEIDVVSPPTALWHAWAARRALPKPKRLRLVVIGGEGASMSAWEQWKRSAAGSVRLLNAYGPTETTITATFFEPPGAVQDAVLTQLSVMPIGRPVAGNRVVLLDGLDRRVPLGAQGDLIIFGSGVALGYAEGTPTGGFGNISIEGVPQGKGYRSGDRAFMVPGGDLCFIGRRDRQSKVRGYRVDLDGLGVFAGLHPKVKQAVFQIVGTTDRKRLVAYVVSEGLTDTELVQHLRTCVPSYSLPDAVVFLDRLPLTPAGKIDTRALPTPPEPEPAVVEASQFATDELTRTVLDVWTRFLPGRQIGPTQRFFDDLGGDSLTAVRMLTELGSRLALHIPVAFLVNADTVASLSEALRKLKSRGETRRHVVPLRETGDLTPLFLVHGGDGHGLAFKDLVSALDKSRPCYAFEAAPFMQTDRDLSIREMAETYVQELKREHPPGPVVLAGFCMGGLIAIEMTRLLHAAKYVVVLLGLINTYAPGWPRLLPAWSRGISTALRLHRQRGPAYAARGLAKRTLGWVRRKMQGSGYEEMPLTPLEQKLYKAQLAWDAQKIPAQVALFRGTPDPGWKEPDALGWESVGIDEFTIYSRLDTHHVHLMKEPHASVLAAQLTEAVTRAEARVSGSSTSRFRARLPTLVREPPSSTNG